MIHGLVAIRSAQRGHREGPGAAEGRAINLLFELALIGAQGTATSHRTTPLAQKSTITSSSADLDTTEGKGGDVDENGGELNICFTTSTYPPHISLTFSIVAGITAEVKSYVTTRGYGQGQV